MRVNFFPLTVILAILLAACQSPVTQSGGSVTISLPNLSATSRTLVNGGKGDTFRIQLVKNHAIVPLSGQDYLSQAGLGQTVTIDSLPTGSNFQIYVSSGNFNSTNTFFETGYFGASSAFSISAGASTPVTVTLTTTPVAIVEDAVGSHAATVVSPSLVFINGSNLSTTSGNPATVASQSTAVTGYLSALPTATVYGLSNVGGGTLWINTNQGIAVSASSAAASLAVASATPLGSPGAYGSGILSVTDSSSAQAYPFAYYYGSGLTAGLAVGSSVSGTTATWSTFSSLLNLSAGSQIYNQLAKLKQVIYDVAPTTDYLYLATGLGVFRVEGALLSQSTTALGNNLANGEDAHGTSLYVFASDGSLIQALSAYSNQSSKAYVFGGSSNGLFAATANPVTGVPTTGDGKLDVVDGTSGLNITRVASYSNSTAPTVYTAAYSATTREVLILNNTTVVNRIPALAGFPYASLQLTWYKPAGTSTLYLVIVGDTATVSYPVATW